VQKFHKTAEYRVEFEKFKSAYDKYLLPMSNGSKFFKHTNREKWQTPISGRFVATVILSLDCFFANFFCQP
jgi:hypothetical protein